VLPGISTEQLRSRLNRMVADGMLTRKRYREVPPRVDYELTERAQELAPILGELARWGYEWAWGPPRPSERVDLGAVFRTIPGLIKPGSTSSGTIALTVTDGKGGEPMEYRVTLGRDAVTLRESSEGRADAGLSGSMQAWIEALSPAGNRGGLRHSGDRKLADELLQGFALATSESADVSAGMASA
jgi:hypothetical protein